MAINPEEITTVRVDQLANVGLTLESLFPHTVGTELTSSSIQDLATLVATTIETLNGFGFLPVSVTDGQTLPAIPTNPSFILVGAGTYTNLNGFPDIICTENLNALMTLTDHWEIAVEIPINPLTGSVQSVTGSAVDNTDPLNPVVNLDSAITSVNGLTGAVVLDGTNIEVTDPTTSTDATLNNALQNIFDNSGGATPDLQAVTDVGNTITDGTDTNTVSASAVSIGDGSDNATLNKTKIEITDFTNIAFVDKYGLTASNGTDSAVLSDGNLGFSNGVSDTFYRLDKITVNSVDYPLPTGVSSPLATLADITASTPDLQAVTDVDNTITDGTDANVISANFVNISDGIIEGVLNKNDVQFTDFISGNQTAVNRFELYISNGTDETRYQRDKITVNSVDYPLPTGASSPLATLADITGGVSDGDKGDITVSGGGTVWTIDNGVVSDAKIASGIDATKIADGSVSNTEFQRLGGVTSNIQTQLNNKDVLPVIFEKHANVPVFGSLSLNNLEGVSLLMQGGTARSFSDTNVYTRTQRLGLTTATTGNPASARQTITYFNRNSNLDIIIGLGFAENCTNTNVRVFAGISTTTVFSNVEPTTLTNCIGIAKLTTSNNLHLIHNDGSGTATAIDLGANFPSNTVETDFYILHLKTNGGNVDYTVTRVNTGNVASGTLTTDLPATTQALNLGYYAVQNTGANTTTGIDFFGTNLIKW